MPMLATELIEEKKVPTVTVEHDDYFNSDILLNSDDKTFRQKTKNRFKNLTSICQSLFRHFKEIKTMVQALTDREAENQLCADENVQAITAIVEALDAAGLSEFLAVGGLPHGYRKSEQITPEKTKENVRESVETEYPKVWDYMDSYDKTDLFLKKQLQLRKGEHYCNTCKFSQCLTSSLTGTSYECKYSKSKFYRFLSTELTPRKCNDYTSMSNEKVTAWVDEIMIVNLTSDPEVTTYEI